MAKHRRKQPRYQREANAKMQAEAPPGRIPADLSQQAPNNSYAPRTYYEDVAFTCVVVVTKGGAVVKVGRRARFSLVNCP